MLYVITFGFFIAYVAILSAVVWYLINGFVAPIIGASRNEAVIIFYCTLIVAFMLLILANYYTGFLATIYHYFDDTLFGGQNTRSLI